jgi:phage tail-like protein
MSVIPFVAFNFEITLAVPGVNAKGVCGGAFAECDGLEFTMDVKTIHEGGNNSTAIRLAGPVNYGQLTLKRGMSSNFDLWKWADSICKNPSLRTDGTIAMKAADRSPAATFAVYRCLPVKLKVGALNAKDGAIAIEEFQLSYERLKLTSGGATNA